MQTPSGETQMVLSVSKTYIRLKDLIMEKKFLQKETRKLKNLNSHLESRLGEQEQRLGAVTIELNKTWNLVGRMQRQHRQLHTHEQVLRYQLQQKRRMLNEMKEELEYCRRKWDLAKEKNNESQSQWETLRLEFSKRKEFDLNNSGESGYSDSPASEDDDDDEEDSIETQRNSRLKKKLNNMEQFLLTNDQKDRKVVRIHSVSPARITKENLVRRNSDSQITLFATEVFQTTSDEVQPIVHQNICAECGENCVKHSVHFDSDTLAQQKSNDQVKVSKPVVRKELTNAQKLIESKASTSKTKMSSEVRKTTATPKSSTSKNSEESLEDMFLRLSGSDEHEHSSSQEETDPTNADQTDSNENQTESIESQDQVDSVVNVPISQEEREMRRVARIERLEGQCKLLIKQVTRASSLGDELNRRINEVHSRYTPVRETESNQNSEEPQPSTSSTQASPVEKSSKTDEQCLTATEVEYLSRRDERLKRLEAETQAYMNRVKSINRRATDVDTKLEFVHGLYGSESDGGESSTKTETSNQQNTSETDQSIDDSQPSTSGSEKTEQPSTSDEQCLSATEKEYLARREERLKRLEAESQAYTNRINAMNERATNVDNKLELLHERHGNNDENADSSANTPNQLSEESLNQQQQQSDANQTTDDPQSCPQSNQNDEEPSSSQ